MKYFFSLLSIDEQKLSSLILCLIAFCIIAGVECYFKGDVSSNVKDLIETFIFAITGMNVFDKAKSAYIVKKGGTEENESNNNK